MTIQVFMKKRGLIPFIKWNYETFPLHASLLFFLSVEARWVENSIGPVHQNCRIPNGFGILQP